jgi:hypothetical protein
VVFVALGLSKAFPRQRVIAFQTRVAGEHEFMVRTETAFAATCVAHQFWNDILFLFGFDSFDFSSTHYSSISAMTHLSLLFGS